MNKRNILSFPELSGLSLSILSLSIITLSTISFPSLSSMMINEWQAKSYLGDEEVCYDQVHYRAKWWVGATDIPSVDAAQLPVESGWGATAWLPLIESNLCINSEQEDVQQPPQEVQYKVNRRLEVELTQSEAKQVHRDYLTLTDNQKLPIVPDLIRLDNIEIKAGQLINKTPYRLNEIYLQSKGNIYRLELTPSLDAYSLATLPAYWHQAEFIHSQSIANSIINYRGERGNSSQTSNSNYLNKIERDNAERAHIYERYMMNHPNMLDEVYQRLNLICEDNRKCFNYRGGTEKYAIDTYFAKSISGVTTTLWMDSDIWGIATGGPLNQKESHAEQQFSTVWMHPELMEYINTGTHLKQIEGAQALMHEIYHNYGFSHDSGWASTKGIDDLFGEKFVNYYRADIDKDYIPSELLVIDKYDAESNRYQFELYGESNNINLRLLSTTDLDVEVTESGTHQVSIQFLQQPKADVYASFYTDTGQQMATVPLNFVTEINTQPALESFNEQIVRYLESSPIVYVTTVDGSWVKDFHLPTLGVEVGQEVHFTRHAGYASYVHYNGQDKETLIKDKTTMFRFNGEDWSQIN
ncbi:hypothetical protein L0B53_18210 [Vibrio sp. SS-MA-C1-2]|uniref:hypothetical protein n=1 Tax=Vibrio sp. SS-MA-C1-2 TaxID=2908646 RepID=UPI001F43BB81|nr:hypothetical protein [Vibrio sp. SS-MA-C1-2]UJF18876.1 hypothetical protein L0B53_18210 [Vibrio sp. SS-MA-C1-2]